MSQAVIGARLSSEPESQAEIILHSTGAYTLVKEYTDGEYPRCCDPCFLLSANTGPQHYVWSLTTVRETRKPLMEYSSHRNTPQGIAKCRPQKYSFPERYRALITEMG